MAEARASAATAAPARSAGSPTADGPGREIETVGPWPARPVDRGPAEVLRSLDELRAVAADWAELEARALEPNPFFGPSFLLPLLEARGWLPSLRVLLCRDPGGALLAVLPVMRAGLGPGAAVPTLRSAYTPAQPHGFLGTPLLRSDRAADALDRLLDALDRGLPGGGLLELFGYATDGPFAELLERRLAARRQPFLELAGWSRRLFRRRASAEAYLAEALGSRHRAELRRQRRQLERLGVPALRRLAAGEPVVPWVEAYLQLEASGWKGRSGTALACDPADRAFFAAMCEALHAANRLAFDALELDGRPIAITCSLRADPAPRAAEFVFKIAYDEQLARQSPGMQLQLALLSERHAAEDAPAWVDSCAAPTDSFYRQIWLDERRLGHLLIAARRPPWPAILTAVAFARRLRERWRAARAGRSGA